MGNCWQTIFPSSRSVLKKESLLNYKQLTSMIKPTTPNDRRFYSSPNLVAVQQFLNNIRANTEIDEKFVTANLTLIRNFIKDLKQEGSDIKQQLHADFHDVKAFVQAKKQTQGQLQDAAQHIQASLVILRVQVQAILLGGVLASSTVPGGDWDLYLEIEQQASQNYAKASKSDYLKPEYLQPRQLIGVLKIEAEQSRDRVRTCYKNIQDFKKRQQKPEKAEVLSENN